MDIVLLVFSGERKKIAVMHSKVSYPTFGREKDLKVERVMRGAFIKSSFLAEIRRFTLEGGAQRYG